MVMFVGFKCMFPFLMLEPPFFYIVKLTQTFVKLPPSVFSLPSPKINIDPAISWGLEDELLLTSGYVQGLY